MYYETSEQRAERRRKEAEAEDRRRKSVWAAIKAEAERLAEQQLGEKLRRRKMNVLG